MCVCALQVQYDTKLYFYCTLPIYYTTFKLYIILYVNVIYFYNTIFMNNSFYKLKRICFYTIKILFIINSLKMYNTMKKIMSDNSSFIHKVFCSKSNVYI